MRHLPENANFVQLDPYLTRFYPLAVQPKYYQENLLGCFSSLIGIKLDLKN